MIRTLCVAALLCASATNAQAAFDLLCNEVGNGKEARPEARFIIGDDGKVSFFEYDEEIGSYTLMERPMTTATADIQDDVLLITMTTQGDEETQRRMRIDRITGIATLSREQDQRVQHMVQCRQTVRAF